MKVLKNGSAQLGQVDEAQLALINRLTLRPVGPDEVYIFRVAGCDDQVDRDFERFPVETLRKLAPMFVGRPVIFDHNWSADKQTARIYNATVEKTDGVNQLIFSCYMLQYGNSSTIAAIDAGILKEVSVGCMVKKCQCSICGKEISSCGHRPGMTYNGQLCVGDLLEPTDAYEMSFVAVPAQPGAGVVKSYEEKEKSLLDSMEKRIWLAVQNEKWRY